MSGAIYEQKYNNRSNKVINVFLYCWITLFIYVRY